jgi:hypothetical protein
VGAHHATSGSHGPEMGHLRDEDEPLELRPRGTLRLSADLDSDDIAAFRDGFVGVVSLGSGVQLTSHVERLNLLDHFEGRG